MEDSRYENKMERLILFVYSLYTFAMAAVSAVLEWGHWVEIVILLGLLISWVIYLKKYRTYRFRAIMTSVFALMNFMIYGCKAESFFGILATMAALVILLAVYRIKEIMYIAFGVSVFLLLHHEFISKTIAKPGNTTELARILLQLCAIFTVEFVTYYLVKTQITDRERLNNAIEELKLAENSKSDFLTNVSHEIRTPVNAVCGISEMMLQEEMPQKLKEDVHDIQMAGRNLQRIISDLLDFTELQSGEFTLIEEPYNLTSTVNDVMNMTIAQIGIKDIDLVVDCDARIPRSLVGDEQKIRRAMVNILNNAVKFTAEGCIRLTIGYREESYGVNLIVNIKDTGKGIKEEQLEKIFTNFNQVDTRKNRKEDGVGLGLAITRALIQKMGGFIRINSEWKRGTEVQFVIPQKVLDEHPIIEVKNSREKQIISYVNLEKYRYGLTRESYMEMLDHMAQQLKLPYLPCRNLAELKRRLEKNHFTHVFLGWEEYEEDSEFFEKLVDTIPVFVILDRSILEKNIDKLEDSKVYHIVKPFYALSIASVLNGEAMLLRTNETSGRVRFVAPEASVLVVDDSLMNLKVVEGLLRPYQIRVFTAESGAEALQKIERGDFDFVFMDHMMPEMDGVEALHKIRSKPGNYFQNVPIIALTANAVGGAREMFLQEGFQDFVSKPIELPVLERVLRKYIPEHKKRKNETQTRTQTETREKEQEKAEIEPQQKPQMKLKTINLQTGIRYAGGSKADYLEILEVYCSSGRQKITDIQKYYEAEDWKNYTTFVHAVKSTSLGIGAEELSEKAKRLEEAGRERERDYIVENHEEMMKLYQEVMGEAETKILKKDEKKPVEDDVLVPITAEQLEKLLTHLKEALDTFEADSVKPVLDELEKCQYQGLELQNSVRVIREKVDAFDFMGAEEEVQLMQNGNR